MRSLLSMSRSLSLRVEFKIPEQGMERFEVLSRGTCFFIARHSGDPTLLSASHISHPFLWKSRFYPELEWLSFVQEEHVRRVIEFRCPESGDLLGESEALGEAVPHKDLDLVKVDCSEVLRDGSLGMPRIVPLVGDKDDFVGTTCTVDGFVLRPRPEAEEGTSTTDSITGVDDLPSADVHANASECTGVLYPESVRGELVARGDVRAMVRTDAVLEMGACGAPVVFMDEERDQELCIGLVEGIVPLLPEDHQEGTAAAFYEKYQGCASVINHEVLRSFVA